MKVINLFGGPGTGKSTQAAGLFYKMKLQGMNVELVTEYAKDLVWQGRLENMLDQQEYIFAKQNHRLHRLRGKVDYVVMDSPIILGIVYMDTQSTPVVGALIDLMMQTFHTYDNYNFYLRRGGQVKYVEEGRMQTESEALDVGTQVKALLDNNSIDYTPVCVYEGDVTAGTMLDCVIEDKMQGLRALV